MKGEKKRTKRRGEDKSGDEKKNKTGPQIKQLDARRLFFCTKAIDCNLTSRRHGI